MISLQDALDSSLSSMGGNNRFWKDRERNYAVNEGLCLYQALAGARYITFPSFTQIGVPYYNVPRQIVSLQRMSYNGVPLQDGSIDEFDLFDSGWESVSGAPLRWAPVGVNKFALSPVPDASGLLALEGFGGGAKTFSTGDILELGDEEILRILGYAHHYLTFKEGSDELQHTVPAVQDLLKAAGETNMRTAAVAAAAFLAGLQRNESSTPIQAGQGEVGMRGRK